VATTQFEKRGVAISVPEWIMDNCIQCNQCAMVCPHASIRPFLVTEEELRKAPAGFEAKKAVGKELKDYSFRIQVDTLDCMGCGNCADICPAKKKALVMKPLETQTAQQVPLWDYAVDLPVRDSLVGRFTVKGSQFCQPLLEFSGACAGCGETAVRQAHHPALRDRMIIGNATGCSSIWAGRRRRFPTCTNKNGHGPTWGNSLFEDSAEFTYGMFLGVLQQRRLLAERARKALEAKETPAEAAAALQGWLDHMQDPEGSRTFGDRLKALLPKHAGNPLLAKIRAWKSSSPRSPSGSFWATGRLRHRLRRHRPRPGHGRGHQRDRLRHRGLLQHRRAVLQGDPTGSVAKFAASGKEDPQEGHGPDDDVLRLRLHRQRPPWAPTRTSS